MSKVPEPALDVLPMVKVVPVGKALLIPRPTMRSGCDRFRRKLTCAPAGSALPLLMLTLLEPPNAVGVLAPPRVRLVNVLVPPRFNSVVPAAPWLSRTVTAPPRLALTICPVVVTFRLMVG